MFLTINIIILFIALAAFAALKAYYHIQDIRYERDLVLFRLEVAQRHQLACQVQELMQKDSRNCYEQ